MCRTAYASPYFLIIYSKAKEKAWFNCIDAIVRHFSWGIRHNIFEHVKMKQIAHDGRKLLRHDQKVSRRETWEACACLASNERNDKNGDLCRIIPPQESYFDSF